MISQDIRDRVVELRRGGARQMDIAVELGIAVSTVSGICRAASLGGHLGYKPVLDGFEITKITTRDRENKGGEG